MENILVINPGSTSTKIALYRGETQVFTENIEHTREELAGFSGIPEQLPFRLALVEKTLRENGIDGNDLSLIMGRGGLIPHLKTGAYRVGEAMEEVLQSGSISQHASNLGGLMAASVAKQYGISAFIYDAVTSGELSEIAKITGFPDVVRQSKSHVLNSRAMARVFAHQQGRRYEDMRFIVAHLGGGISVTAHEGGRIIDSIADDDGQFSPERSGSIPLLDAVELCFSGKYTKEEMKAKIRGRGGLHAHLGTGDFRRIEEMIRAGDQKAEKVFKAQAYQISKGIGLLSVTLKGKIDQIILTGGGARSIRLTEMIREYVSFLAPVTVMPGEREMEALALAGLRILRGEETPREYIRFEGETCIF